MAKRNFSAIISFVEYSGRYRQKKQVWDVGKESSPDPQKARIVKSIFQPRSEGGRRRAPYTNLKNLALSSSVNSLRTCQKFWMYGAEGLTSRYLVFSLKVATSKPGFPQNNSSISEAVNRERILIGRMYPIPALTASSNFLVSLTRYSIKALTNFSLSSNFTSSFDPFGFNSLTGNELPLNCVSQTRQNDSKVSSSISLLNKEYIISYPAESISFKSFSEGEEKDIVLQKEGARYKLSWISDL
mmetsp:Transcript_28347/g.43927  ORF Transcript_28347/g.43927 Transcript_28347/m.43927 type:complete len:243 (+) Transcript_28347:124-852(+)